MKLTIIAVGLALLLLAAGVGLWFHHRATELSDAAHCARIAASTPSPPAADMAWWKAHCI